MEHIDIIMKNLFKDKEKFADLFNHCIFDGHPILSGKDLTEQNTETVYIPRHHGKGALHRYRDLFMFATYKNSYFFLGLEGQGQIDYSMPIRSMLYDALSYDEQRRDLELKKHTSTGKYYRGKLSKNQKIIPVISLVLYYGSEPWVVPDHLQDMMELPDIPNIHSKIPDYFMNVINVFHIKNPQKFFTDLQFIFTVIQYREDKEKLYQYISENKEHFDHMDTSSKEAVLALLNHKNLIRLYDTTKKGEFYMCNAINELIQEGRREGEREGKREGKREGFRIGKQHTQSQMVLRMSKHGMNLNDIMNISGLPENEIQKILSNTHNSNTPKRSLPN